MSYSNLYQYVNKLEKAGELLRIEAFVSTEFEITEITDRMSKTGNGGKALLFENNGTGFPLLINMFGSQNRINMSLGVNSLDQIGNGIEELFKSITKPKLTLIDKLKTIPLISNFSSWLPQRLAKRGECQEIVHSTPDLSVFPILKCWPADGGKFITFPMVITQDPHSGIRNVGMYRMQVFDQNTTGMHWHKHKTGARHYQEYKKLGKKMPVAVALGGDPALTFAATAPLPDNVDEFLFAGFLRKKSVKLAKCLTNDLYVPDCADIILEGYVDPQEDLAWEGPFGDHTGFYSLADWYPKFHITCITHRKNAIYPTTIVGIPPMEDAWIAKATERIFLPLIKLSMLPELKDMNMPFEGVAHNLALIDIEKTFSGQGPKVMNAMWGAGQMMFNKILVATNSVKKLDDYVELAKIISQNTNPSTDIYFSRGPLDVLDHSSSKFAFGGKMFVDATKKYLEETKPNLHIHTNIFETEKVKEQYPEIADCNSSFLKVGISFVVISIKKQKNEHIKKLSYSILNSGQSDVKALLFVDSNIEIHDISTTLWVALNNMDAERDNFVSIEHNCLIMDGTQKQSKLDAFERDWPNIVTSSKETIDIIDKKWDSLNIGTIIHSPSTKYKNISSIDGAIADRSNR